MAMQVMPAHVRAFLWTVGLNHLHAASDATKNETRMCSAFGEGFLKTHALRLAHIVGGNEQMDARTSHIFLWDGLSDVPSLKSWLHDLRIAPVDTRGNIGHNKEVATG